MNNVLKGQVFVVKEQNDNVKMYVGESYRVVSVGRDVIKMVVVGKQYRGEYGLKVSRSLLEKYFVLSNMNENFKVIKKGQVAYPKQAMTLEADGQLFAFEADKPYLIVKGGNSVSIYHSEKVTLKVTDTTIYNNFNVVDRKPTYEKGITVKTNKIGSLKFYKIMFNGKLMVHASVNSYTNVFHIESMNKDVLSDYRNQLEYNYYQTQFGKLDNITFAKHMVGYEYYNFNGFKTFKEYVDIRMGN